jgi:TolB protein
MVTRFAVLTSTIFVMTLLGVGGCRAPEFNPTPTTSEADSLVNAVQLTHNFGRAGEAYFSPDVRWIIFQASVRAEEPYQMYLAQLKWNGGRITGIHTPIQITPTGSKNTCGYFSPDGESILFASTAGKPQPREAAATQPGGYLRSSGTYRWDMPAEMEIFRADNWKAAVAAVPPGGSADLAKYPLTRNDDYDAECAYSPDGRAIIYSSRVGGDSELFAMRADGSRPVRLTTTKGYDGGPFFSPDGKRIVYRSDRQGNDLLQVFTSDLKFDASGDIVGLANERQLTHGETVNWGPYWHTDGRHLVWATSIHGHQNYEVYLMRDDGTHKTRLTHTMGADVLPVVSPDGRWMMWTSKRGPERTSQVWVARLRLPKGS